MISVSRFIALLGLSIFFGSPAHAKCPPLDPFCKYLERKGVKVPDPIENIDPKCTGEVCRAREQTNRAVTHAARELAKTPQEIKVCISDINKCAIDVLSGAVSIYIHQYIQGLYAQSQGRTFIFDPAFISIVQPHYDVPLNDVTYAQPIVVGLGQEALAYCDRIFFPKEIRPFQDESDLNWVLHEFEHIVQCKKRGRNTFIVEYLLKGGYELVTKARVGIVHIHDLIEFEEAADRKAAAIRSIVWQEVQRSQLVNRASASGLDPAWTNCIGGPGNYPNASLFGCSADKQPYSDSPESLAATAYNRGAANYIKGQMDRAIDDYNQAIRLSPVFAEAFFARGAAYDSMGQLALAIQDYDQAIRLMPNLADAYVGRGGAYRDLGQADQAIKDLDQAIQLKPDLADAFIVRGHAYLAKRQFDRSIQDYDLAIHLQPGNSYAYAGRGAAYRAKGQLDRAIQDYDQAIRHRPDFAQAFLDRGAVYTNKGQLELAIQDYDQAIRLMPNLADAYVGRGGAYRDLGQADQAIKDLDQAIQLKPDLADAFVTRGNAYLDKRQYDRSIQDYDQAIHLQPGNSYAYAGRGAAYQAKGQLDPAIQDYNQAIRLMPEFALALYNRGTAYQAKGQLEQAAQDFDKAIRLRPDLANPTPTAQSPIKPWAN